MFYYFRRDSKPQIISDLSMLVFWHAFDDSGPKIVKPSQVNLLSYFYSSLVSRWKWVYVQFLQNIQKMPKYNPSILHRSYHSIFFIFSAVFRLTEFRLFLPSISNKNSRFRGENRRKRLFNRLFMNCVEPGLFSV